MDVISLLPIESINDENMEQIVELLNNDKKLLAALESNNRKLTKKDFIEKNKDWASSKNADMFAIFVESTAIGMISLSHQDLLNHKAEIGYWIGSNYWGKGYTSKAFLQILDFAISKGIRYVSSTIKEDNVASKRIWEKYGANMILKNNRFYVSLTLPVTTKD